MILHKKSRTLLCNIIKAAGVISTHTALTEKGYSSPEGEEYPFSEIIFGESPLQRGGGARALSCYSTFFSASSSLTLFILLRSTKDTTR